MKCNTAMCISITTDTRKKYMQNTNISIKKYIQYNYSFPQKYLLLRNNYRWNY